MNNLYDTLEICLQEMDNGKELEAVLANYPELAAELRPLLQAADTARFEAVPMPSVNLVHRNQAKVLKRFDDLWREEPAIQKGFSLFQRVAVAFMLLVLFFMSGTSLVRAAYDSLPGDGLYSMKRSLEDITLFLTFDAQARENLGISIENERLHEIHQLFASGRSVQVDFAGIVTRMDASEWQVADILVRVSSKTRLPGQRVQVGAAVRVFGITNGSGLVQAERVEFVTDDKPLPNDMDIESAVRTPESTATSEQQPATATPEIETPVPTQTPKMISFEGILVSMDTNVWTIDTILVNIDQAVIIGNPVLGARVKAEGYYGVDSIFVGMRLEIIDSGQGTNNENLNANDDESPVINGNENALDNSNDDSNNDNDSSGGGGSGNNDNGGNDNGGGHGNGG